eukprot:1619172-Rhodomonas_salina.3
MDVLRQLTFYKAGLHTVRKLRVCAGLSRPESPWDMRVTHRVCSGCFGNRFGRRDRGINQRRRGGNLRVHGMTPACLPRA